MYGPSYTALMKMLAHLEQRGWLKGLAIEALFNDDVTGAIHHLQELAAIDEKDTESYTERQEAAERAEALEAYVHDYGAEDPKLPE